MILERAVTLERLPEPLAAPAKATVEDGSDGAPLGAARALADQGRLDAARVLCQAALARDRLDPEAYLLLAAICQELGDIHAALEALRRAIYLDPESAAAHFLLGALLVRGGARRRGRRCLENAFHLLESRPGDEALDGAGGLTAGRLRETARAYLAEG